MTITNEKFNIGDLVSSRPIGNRPAFNGSVVAKFDTEILDVGGRKIKIGGYYHVTDENGDLWHREDYDLKQYENKQ